ncbi:MAG: TIGR02266 family protein [Myxococcota bacterium]
MSRIGRWDLPSVTMSGHMPMARSAQAAVSPEFIEGIERRKSPRADLLVRVNYTAVDALFSEFARNVNEGGIFIETETPQPIGTAVELEFKLPGMDEPLQVIGRVVRVDHEGTDGSGMGIEFENLDDHCRDMINDVIRKLRTK